MNILEKGQDRQVNNNTKNKYHIAPKNCTKPPYKENQGTETEKLSKETVNFSFLLLFFNPMQTKEKHVWGYEGKYQNPSTGKNKT